MIHAWILVCTFLLLRRESIFLLSSSLFPLLTPSNGTYSISFHSIQLLSSWRKQTSRLWYYRRYGWRKSEKGPACSCRVLIGSPPAPLLLYTCTSPSIHSMFHTHKHIHSKYKVFILCFGLKRMNRSVLFFLFL